MIYREDYDNAQDYVNALIRRRRNRKRLIVGLIVLCLIGLVVFFITWFKIRNVQISGNTRYTNEEISEMVTGDFLSDNSVILSLRYRNRQIRDVPFIEQMDVTVVTHDTIKITVYEKSLAGYVDYLGSNFYFGRDGTVVESSKEVVEGVPRITGLSFDHIVLYEQLPVENPEIFGRILNVTQLLSKYDLSADSIYFDSAGNMTIYFGEVRVAMGGDDYTDEKLSNVSKILPSLDGRGEGTLKMSGYTPSTKYITYVVKDGKASNIASAGTDAATASGAMGGAAQEDDKVPAEEEPGGVTASGDVTGIISGPDAGGDGSQGDVTVDPAGDAEEAQ